MSQYIGNNSGGKVEVCTPKPPATGSLLCMSATDQTKASFSNPSKLVITGSAGFIPTANDNQPYAEVLDEESTNYIVNPSFETNVTDGWVTAGCSVVQDTAVHMFGLASARVTTTGSVAGQGIQHALVSATPGEVWCLSAFVVGEVGFTSRLQLEFLDVNLAVITTNTRDDVNFQTDFALSYDSNQPIPRHYVSATAPARTAWVRASFINPNATIRTYNIDGVQLEKNQAYPTSYFDGSLGTPGLMDWVNPNQPHNSISHRAAGRQILGSLQSSAQPVVHYDNGMVNYEGELRVGTYRSQLRAYGNEGTVGIQAMYGSGGETPLLLDATPNEAVVINSTRFGHAGSSFPGSPGTKEICFRSDRGVLYFWDGATWQALAPPRYSAFHVYRSSNIVGGAGADNLITCDVKEFDLGNNYNTGTGSFTASEAGVYQFFGAARTSTATLISVKLYLNGSNWKEGVAFTGTGTVNDGTVGVITQLALNDTVQLRMFGTAAPTIVGGQAFTYLSGARIG